MRRTDSLEKTLKLGKMEGRRRKRHRGWDSRMASPIQWTRFWAHWGRQWRTGKPGVLQPTGSQRVGRDWATEWVLYLCFIFGYVIYFELILVKGIRFAFMCECPVATTPFVEKISSSTLHYLCFTYKDQQTIFLWVYFWDLLFCSINIFVYLFVNTTVSS